MKKRKSKSKRRVYWTWKGQLNEGSGAYLFPIRRKYWDRKLMVRVRVTVL